MPLVAVVVEQLVVVVVVVVVVLKGVGKNYQAPIHPLLPLPPPYLTLAICMPPIWLVMLPSSTDMSISSISSAKSMASLSGVAVLVVLVVVVVVVVLGGTAGRRAKGWTMLLEGMVEKAERAVVVVVVVVVVVAVGFFCTLMPLSFLLLVISARPRRGGAGGATFSWSMPLVLLVAMVLAPALARELFSLSILMAAVVVLVVIVLRQLPRWGRLVVVVVVVGAFRVLLALEAYITARPMGGWKTKQDGAMSRH